MLETLERPTAASIRALEFKLPAELEARVPPEARGLARDEVRLMVSRMRDDRIVHSTFRDIRRFLEPGDLVVVNESATLPAALTARRDDGTELAFHLSTELEPGIWVVEPRKTAAGVGEVLSLPEGAHARLLSPHRESARLWVARLALPSPVYEYLHRWGRAIKYDYVQGDWPIESYQTVYAARPGSAEMPSAGRAFSEAILTELREDGVGIAAITLHAGVSSLEEHEPPYEEWFDVGAETADAINFTRAHGRRVVAVGTTVIRALESASDGSGRVEPASGWTGLVITPERGIGTADGLLTGFHEPRATHLAMIEALAGRRHIELCYEAALVSGYLWHEFGDLHLIV
jgi:S-adenosylmethionine:tRNA ribosyltransferase-isomerase